MNVVSELRKRYVVNGKIKPGATSRLAEHLECSRSTVKNCIVGDENGILWQFSKARLETLQRIISLKIPLCSKKPGPKAKNNSCQ